MPYRFFEGAARQLFRQFHALYGQSVDAGNRRGRVVFLVPSFYIMFEGPTLHQEHPDAITKVSKGHAYSSKEIGTRLLIILVL